MAINEYTSVTIHHDKYTAYQDENGTWHINTDNGSRKMEEMCYHNKLHSKQRKFLEYLLKSGIQRYYPYEFEPMAKDILKQGYYDGLDRDALNVIRKDLGIAYKLSTFKEKQLISIELDYSNYGGEEDDTTWIGVLNRRRTLESWKHQHGGLNGFEVFFNGLVYPAQKYAEDFGGLLGYTDILKVWKSTTNEKAWFDSMIQEEKNYIFD